MPRMSKANFGVVILATMVILFLAIPALAQETPPIAGNYHVEGTNPNGSTYKGQATIEQTSVGYRMTWTIGGASHSGLGKMKDGRLVIHWQGGGASGLVIYKRDASGVWHGVWGGPSTTDPSKMRGREILRPMTN